MKVKFSNVRLAFPALFEVKTVNGEGEPRNSAAFIFLPEHPCVKEIEAAITQVAKEKWGPKADSVLKFLRTGLKICLHDGDEKAEYEGYPVISLSLPAIKHCLWLFTVTALLIIFKK